MAASVKSLILGDPRGLGNRSGRRPSGLSKVGSMSSEAPLNDAGCRACCILAWERRSNSSKSSASQAPLRIIWARGSSKLTVWLLFLRHLQVLRAPVGLSVIQSFVGFQLQADAVRGGELNSTVTWPACAAGRSGTAARWRPERPGDPERPRNSASVASLRYAAEPCWEIAVYPSW